MNLSRIIEPEFKRIIEGLDQEGPPPAPPSSNMIDLFWNFETDPVFIGHFKGPGINVNINGINVITWKFTDRNSKEWLIPQWSALNVPQGNFRGFNLEEPGKFIYQLNYKAFEYLPNGGTRHVVEIFRKLPP